jgi:hypothetical protein
MWQARKFSNEKGDTLRTNLRERILPVPLNYSVNQVNARSIISNDHLGLR